MSRRDIANDTKGWLHPDEGMALARWAATAPGPWLELGTYCGKSTVWLGDAAEKADTVLFAVDWHSGSPEMDRNQACHDPDVLDAEGNHDTVPHLRRTLRRAELTDTVVPIIGKSETVARYWSIPVGFMFIDACHDAAVIDDMEMWQGHVSHVLAFHDSDIPVITQAITQAQNKYGWTPAERVESLTVLVR